MTNNPYSKIQHNTIMTASPQELTLMLYDGAIKFGNQASVALEAQDYAKAHNYIMRVEDIIEELQITLDMEYSVSEGLYLMYDYIYRQLINANIKKDKELLVEAIGLIREIRNTWKEAMQQMKLSNQTKAL